MRLCFLAVIAWLAALPAPLAWAAGTMGPHDTAPHTGASPEAGMPMPGIPPVLANAVEAAIGSHPAVQAARMEQQARKADRRGAQWQRFPSLSVEALTVTRGSSNSAASGVTANVVLEQPLWSAGRIDAVIRRAREREAASNAGLDESSLDIALRLVQSYYDLALSTRRETILEEGLTDHLRLVETISRRVEQEVSARSDLDLGLARKAQVEQEKAQANSQRRSSYARLLELTGLPGFDLGSMPPYLPDLRHGDEDQAIAAMLACNPTLRRLGFDQQAAASETRMAKSALFPHLVGQVSHNEITGSRAGLALKLQTGNGLSGWAAVGSAEARAQGAWAQTQATQRELRDLLRQDFVTISTARERAETGTRAADAAMLVTLSYKRQFIAGRRSWLDVMNAVREATQSRLSVAEAEMGAMAAYARIALRTCRWAPAGSAPDTSFAGSPAQ